MVEGELGRVQQRPIEVFTDLELIAEAGLFDAESLATSTFALEETSDGYQATADRTTVSSVIVMS